MVSLEAEDGEESDSDDDDDDDVKADEAVGRNGKRSQRNWMATGGTEGRITLWDVY